jgi:hypothetical protein
MTPLYNAWNDRWTHPSYRCLNVLPPNTCFTNVASGKTCVRNIRFTSRSLFVTARVLFRIVFSIGTLACGVDELRCDRVEQPPWYKFLLRRSYVAPT